MEAISVLSAQSVTNRNVRESVVYDKRKQSECSGNKKNYNINNHVLKGGFKCFRKQM